jgi:hypothetical protein
MSVPAQPGRWSRLRAEAERRLGPAEVAAYLGAPVSEAERDDVLSQIRWFRRRYPTAAERLAYVRRAYRRWSGPMAGKGE